MANPEAHNIKLISQDTLQGFGGLGEGMSLQIKNGRRILWLAHESAPKNFTAVDVTDKRHPRIIVQTELPHRNVRSNSLEVCGDLMAVAYQTSTHGLTPAGIELFDISVPETPRSISFFDCSGPASRGVHQVWFVDGRTIHFAGGAPDFTPRNLLDDQPYRCIDVSDPTRPREIGRWWYPGVAEGDDAPPPPRHPTFDSGWRAHNTNVYPDHPDRAYVGYLDGGAFVLDISDMSAIKPVTHWNPHPPFPGFTHTVLPLFDRDLLLVSDECVHDDGRDWPKLVWLLDYRRPHNPVPLATLPLPPSRNTCTAAAATAPTTSTKTAPAPPSAPKQSSSAPTSTAASASTTSRTPYSPARSPTTSQNPPQPPPSAHPKSTTST